jgi:DNA-binding winged helix-turn-helix (wHTH) protein
MMVYSFGEFELHEGDCTVRRTGRIIKVESKVFELLVYLIRHRERFVSREELFKQLWPGQVVSEAALTRCIARLRTALQDVGDEQHFIKTQYNRGYRFVATVTEQREVGATHNDTEATATRAVPLPALSVTASAAIAVLPLVNLSGDPHHRTV